MSSVKLKDGYFIDEFLDLLEDKYWDYRVTELGNWEANSRNGKVEIVEWGGDVTAVIVEDGCNVMKFEFGIFIARDTAELILDAAKEE